MQKRKKNDSRDFASPVQLVRSLCPVKIFRNVGKKLLFHFRCTVILSKKVSIERDSSIMEKNIFRFSIFLEKKDNGKHRRYIILTIIFLKLFLNFNLHLLKIPRSIVHRGEDVVSSLVKRTRGKEERFKDSQGSNEGTISLEELASIRIVKVSRARLYRALDQHCKDLQFQLHP